MQLTNEYTRIANNQDLPVYMGWTPELATLFERREIPVAAYDKLDENGWSVQVDTVNSFLRFPQGNLDVVELTNLLTQYRGYHWHFQEGDGDEIPAIRNGEHSMEDSQEIFHLIFPTQALAEGFSRDARNLVGVLDIRVNTTSGMGFFY
jgi:hypothetical protein